MQHKSAQKIATISPKMVDGRRNLADEEEEVIGVKIIRDAPDPRLANQNLGKLPQIP